MIGVCRRLCVSLALCVFASFVVADSCEAAASASGIMVSVRGEVNVYRGKGPKAAFEGFVLQEGDTIIVKTGARCSGFTPRGARFESQGPARVVLSAVFSDKRRSGISGWIVKQVNDWIGEGRGHPLISRSGRDWRYQIDACSPLLPAPEGRVRVSQSRFVWTTMNLIDQYELTIAPDGGEEIKQVLHDNKATRNDLEPGASYSWKIAPKIESWYVSSNWRSFRVMTEEEEKELDSSLADMPDLEAGVLLLSAGLHGEAIYRFDVAVSGNDRKSALRWRSKAFAAIGLHKEAWRDLLEAVE